MVNRHLGRILTILALTMLLTIPCSAQQTWGGNPMLDALSKKYVKSLNEFMHRFNADEIPDFLQTANPADQRKLCILALFDMEKAPSIDSPEAKRILRFDSTACAEGTRLAITDAGLLAELRCLYKYGKREVELGLFFQYEEIRNGYYGWRLAGVNGLADAGLVDTSLHCYLNPVNHELHFSELAQTLSVANGLFAGGHTVDALSYFAALTASGVLQFVSSSEQRYYLPQVPGWIMVVSCHPRLEGTSGWLIDDVIEIDDKLKPQYFDQLIGL